jgi:hypothetical protein
LVRVQPPDVYWDEMNDESTASRRRRDMTAQRTNAGGIEELMSRESNGIHVALLWNRANDEVKVTVHDSVTGGGFELEVGDHSPLDVFHHPYAYASFDGACTRPVLVGVTAGPA